MDDAMTSDWLPLRLCWIVEIADRDVFSDVIDFILSYLHTLKPGHHRFHGEVDSGRGVLW
jgi:hypothetical protein